MLTVVGDATLREVAHDCGIHRETARRYLHGATPPSLVFVAVFADKYGVSLEWLLCGRGPMARSQLRQFHLADASILDVCTALGTGVERALREVAESGARDREIARLGPRWVETGPKLAIDGPKLGTG